MLTLIFALSTAAQAQTAFEQAMAQHNGVRTREQWINLDGTPHRLIQIGDKYYHLKINPNETKPSAELRCDLVDDPPPKDIEEVMEDGSRSRDFKAKVEKACEKSTGTVTVALDSSFVPLVSEAANNSEKTREFRMGVSSGRSNPGRRQGVQAKTKF